MGTEKNRLNETVLLSTLFFLTNVIFNYLLIFFYSCASCSYAIKYFCNVELMALYVILAGNDVSSFNFTPI